MTSPVNNFTLYLSSEGDSVEIKNFDDNGATLLEQEQALACRTHEHVLTFLENLRNSEIGNLLSFYHVNNTCYDGHAGSWPKGVAHPCPIEKQIDFVRYKMSEATHGVRHSPRSLCAIL